MAALKKSVKKLLIGTAIYVGSIIPISIFLIILSVLTSPATWCSHEYEITEIPPTCVEKGEIHKYCPLCDYDDIDYVDALGHAMKEVSRTEPTESKEGKIVLRCERCQHEESQSIEKLPPFGSESKPYVLNADTWYSNHCNGTSSVKYKDKWVEVSGTVLSISDYGSLKGYYLSGSSGHGLVCWVENGSTSIQYGQKITYVGKVTVEDSKHIEIADGRIKSVSWPTQKQKSPVTISEWTWTRDYVGGVEWNFKLTNNTNNKTVKYVTMEWYCYNAVGDLVYDEITGKHSYSIKYTGPLNAGQTTNLLRNTTLFYSYTYQSAKLTKLIVEFTDGTIIYVNDEAYTDIVK